MPIATAPALGNVLELDVCTLLVLGQEPWSRPAPIGPAPVAGTPRGLALLSAAVAMLRWSLRGRDR